MRKREKEKKKERKREKEERFRALESFLRANTDLSTRRHSWKRNLIREKLNSFKCTSRPLFAPYLPPIAHTSFSLCLPIPPLGFCNPLNVLLALGRLLLVSLSTLAPFSYPLILSQPFSLRKRRSAIHPFSSFFFLSFPFSFRVSPLSLSLLFLYAARERFISLSMFPSSLVSSRSETILVPPRLLFYHSIPN